MPLIIKSYDPEYVDNFPHILGLNSQVLSIYEFTETLTEIVGFRDNPLPNELLDNIHSFDYLLIWWGDNNLGVSEWETGFFDERSSGDYRTLQYSILDIIGFVDNLTCLFFKKHFNDSEVECWNAYRIWEYSFEFQGDDLEPIGLLEYIQFNDTLIHFINKSESETNIWDYAVIWNDSYIFI